MQITDASKKDWPYFARWHYRSHNLGITRFLTLLWHDEEPIGICVFASPALSISQRNRFFGLRGRWSRIRFQTLNKQLMTLSRVVIHPTFRGAGIAAAFVRESCKCCPSPWIESLAQMGHMNPFFEKAGFVRVGVCKRKEKASRKGHSAIYGGKRIAKGQNNHERRPQLTEETSSKSRYSAPVYYIFDNRGNQEPRP